MPTEDEVNYWLRHPEPRNIALRLPANAIGLDIDDYDDKAGSSTIRSLEATLGPLPDTYRCSSRDDSVSGIRVFSVPEDLGHVSDLGSGVEVCQFDYRYMVVAPSIHPSGRPYRWYGPNGDVTAPPNLSEVTPLPEVWVSFMRQKQESTQLLPESTAPHEPLKGEALDAARSYTDKYIQAKLNKMIELPIRGNSALWDQTVFGVARDLVRLTNSWWCTAGYDAVRVRFESACSILEDGTSWDDEMLDKWTRAAAEITDEIAMPAEVQRALQGLTKLDATNDADFGDTLSKLIGTGPLSNIFRRGTELVRFRNIEETGYSVPLEDDPLPISTTVQPGSLAAYVDDSFYVFEWVGSGPNRHTEHKQAPKEVVQRSIERASLRGSVREARILTRAPLVKPDGSMLDQPGYDESIKALYLPLYHNVIQAREWVSSAEARCFLVSENDNTGVFGEISWAGQNNGNDSRATYLAMLLTPLLELICPPPWPLFAVTAPDRGSGKSLLSQCAQILYGGRPRGMSKDSEEFRKQITTALLDTGKIVSFDNIDRPVANDELSRLLTEPIWTDRLLGVSRDVILPNDRVWCVTGNNVQIGADQRRRTVWSMIDANCEKPWERTYFREGNLKGWVRDNWEVVISALGKMITEWMKAGSPLATDAADRRDEFGAWLRAINGILAHSGAQGRVGRSERVSGLVENDNWAALYQAIAEKYRDEPWTVKKLSSDYAMQSFIDNIVPVGQKSAAVTIGKAIAKRENQWIQGYRIVKAGKAHQAVQWQLESTNAWPAETEAPAPSSTSLGIDFNILD